ncbi:MAG: NAD(P)H-hydrate dehydratase [Ignavibacteria bacterium]|nr:NAD(P)H-hydrate dehydratase [Ignavibacteria bacterium]
MIKVVTSSEIKKLDQLASSYYKIPSIILMENAAIGVVDFITEYLCKTNQIDRILILCGHGNNGGDGFAIARHLVIRGFDVTVQFVGEQKKLSKDAKTNFEILKKFEKYESNLKIILTRKPISLRNAADTNLVIDAMLGTGLNSALRKPYNKIVNWINKVDAIKLAVDHPTGLSSDDGFVPNYCFEADYTLTMGLPKIGTLINEGPKNSGQLEIVDISYPNSLSSKSEIKSSLIEISDVKSFLPKRNLDSHKYSVGKVLGISGSKGLTGAAIMSSESALLAGCGGVLQLTTNKLQNVFSKKLKEVMTFSVESENYFLATSDFKKIKPKIEWADILMIGPGLGRKNETAELLWEIFTKFPKKKKVLDADGLNLLADQIISKNLDLSNSILTPHLGEFSRLIRKDVEFIKRNLLQAGSKFAKNNRCILVLKGAPTIIFDEKGNSYINSTGNPGMATVGMGDVLTGIISGLYSQGISAIEAAICGVFIHGLSGDIAKRRKNEFSLISSDVQQNISRAFSLIISG